MKNFPASPMCRQLGEMRRKTLIATGDENAKKLMSVCAIAFHLIDPVRKVTRPYTSPSGSVEAMKIGVEADQSTIEEDRC